MKKIAITVGDPCGVGPEIILAWAWANLGYCECVEIIGHADFIKGLPPKFTSKTIPSPNDFIAGSPSIEGANLALNALNAAAEGCKNGEYAVVVTAPVSKSWMARVCPGFVGQTEFFEKSWGGNAVMCFAGSQTILSLATSHIPLKDVPSALNEGNIKRAVESADTLARKIKKAKNPRIALCGLNPHAGESGMLGSEEIDLINPIAKKLKARYPNLSEALSPDTVFNRLRKNEFDAAVAMYHDQGLGPLKTVDFDTAVNISMGLKFVRTSPDHGTAYDIAGKGIASCKSFANAVDIAKLLSV